MVFKENRIVSRDYLELVFNAAAVLGLPVKPLNMSGFAKVFYSTYSAFTIICFPVCFVISQLLQIPSVAHDLKTLAGVLSFMFMDAVGKKQKHWWLNEINLKKNVLQF